MATGVGTHGDRIAVGADHGGFPLKEHLKGWLEKNGYQVVDCGTHDGSRCDYPVLAAAVAEKVSTGECAAGVMVDGAGIGSSMMANKYPGVRASLCYDVSTARNAREHNDANVLCLGGRTMGDLQARAMTSVFLTTPHAGGRHARRVRKIEPA